MTTDPLIEAALARRARKAPKPPHDGDSWEAEVDRQFKRLRDAGRILSVHRNHPPWRQVGKAKKGVIPVRLMGTGAPDWDVVVPGALIRGDDKFTQRKSFPLVNVKDHQAESLDAWALGGGYPVLLVCARDRRWVLDWRKVSPFFWDVGTASLSPGEMGSMGGEFDDDWLTVWESTCRT